MKKEKLYSFAFKDETGYIFEKVYKRRKEAIKEQARIAGFKGLKIIKFVTDVK